MKWSLKEIAKELGISESTLRRYVQRHGALIPQRKEGSKVFFSEESLLVFRGLRGLYGELRQGAEVQRVLDVLAQPPVSRECAAVTDDALEERLHALASALERAEGALLSLQEENQRLQQEQQMEESRGVHSLETRLLLGGGMPERKNCFHVFSRKNRCFSRKLGYLGAGTVFFLGLFALGSVFLGGFPSIQASSPPPLPSPVQEFSAPTKIPPTPTLRPVRSFVQGASPTPAPQTLFFQKLIAPSSLATPPVSESRDSSRFNTGEPLIQSVPDDEGLPERIIRERDGR